jgi:hypothetical protein
MSVTIQIPDFEFSGFYYAEILEDVIQYLRVNVPEITDESPEEPFIQLARAFALVGHLNNVLLDMVAKERFITTASLRGSVRAHLKLIDYTMAQATPAAVDLLLELAQTFSATSTNVVPATSKFATSETDESPAIVYEALLAQSVGRTDQVGKVFAYDASGNSYTDHTAEAQSSAGNFSPGWGSAGVAGDALYIGAIDFLWNTLNFIIATGMDGANVGRWEFFDGNYSYTAPDSVTNNGTNLTFNLASWLGPASAAGLVVRVTCSEDGRLRGHDCRRHQQGDQRRLLRSDRSVHLGVGLPRRLRLEAAQEPHRQHGGTLRRGLLDRHLRLAADAR